MVKHIVDLSDRENRIIKIVKSRYGLKDKSQALSVILKRYEEIELGHKVRPEFVEEVKKVRKYGKFIKIKDFEERMLGWRVD